MRTRAALRRAARLSPAERRARLLQAASRVFLRRGYAATRVRDVVREARVSRGTFYRHFESKRGLLGVLARELVDRLRPAWETPSEVRTPAELERALASLYGATLRAFHDERATARLLFGDAAAPDAGVARAIVSWEDAWRREATGLWQRAKAGGCLGGGLDPAVAAECALGAVLRLVRARVLRDADPDLAGLAAALARFSGAAAPA
jgi:TetR/AcrR family fatty acid metabolism transcriptional regulator